jgi:hypothetical protein
MLKNQVDSTLFENVKERFLFRLLSFKFSGLSLFLLQASFLKLKPMSVQFILN